jgi:hypothetical protein
MTQSEIIQKYPELFGEPPYDPKETLICFGLEVSPKWLPTLDKGFQQMAEIVKKEKLDDFRITQVKEKFGGLRVYSRYSIDEIDKIIERMEEEVEHICEKCGSLEGKLRTDGWMRVRCDECEKESDD